jgi:hypothetical protein
MTSEEILQIIADNFLCVRRLPFQVTSYWTYREGDEKTLGGFDGRPIYLEGGKTLNATREIVIQNFDLDHFKNEKPSKYCTDIPEKRYKNYIKSFPQGKKLIKETKIIEKGGWWYVKEVKNTSSTVRFSREYDEFFAPTLEEAIQIYLKSKT